MSLVAITTVPFVRTPARSPRSLLARLAFLLPPRRERARLAEREPRRLDDIGRSRREAAREAGLPVWDAPAHWLR
ncbi:MAG: hypothetical protein KJZ85_09515 [Rhodobacteraceae bacterium]|jgi:uncharacterized protein YjiS (DUF1127 family)|nr:hypothetical protein [Paracoccaceae bacterium]